jgi:beta-galactosidase GanA
MASSRRTFLQTAAGGISLTWGGLRIFAGPEAVSPPLPDQNGPRSQQFIYGSAFYRPPNPPASMRRPMLKDVAEKYKFNIIRIYSSWVYHHREPDRFTFDELEEVLGYCDEFGLRVLMGVIIEDAPYWLEEAHPETRYVDANDEAFHLDGSGNNVSGGWPGLCLDWEPVRDAAGKFIQEMARTVGKHSSMYAYDCWNEPHIEPSGTHRFTPTLEQRMYCYCPRTIAEFQQWLERRYGTIDKLNEAWVRPYPDWKAIEPPRHKGTYSDWVDWRRFMIERSTNELRFRVENVRAADTQHVMESHAGSQIVVGPMSLIGVNTWRLAEVVETWGISNFPRWSPVPTMPIHMGAARIEVTRSNAGSKPFWMTELQGGHGSSGLFESPHMRPQDIRLWNWMGVACGAKGLLYWAYHSEATGTEATGFGLVARDGSSTERVVEAAEDNRLIQAHWDIIENYKPKADVALLFDQDNPLLTFAMAGNEDTSTQSFLGYYQALWNSDYWVDFIEPAGLAQADYKVIIAPWHLMGKQETCDGLRRFVEAGGTLIIETAFGLFDDRCFYNPTVPPFGLSEAFGYREKESYYLDPGDESHPLPKPSQLPPSERIYLEPEIEVSEPRPFRFKARTFLTPIEIIDAEPIARHQGLTVGAKKELGKGQVYYFGTNLGASISAGDANGIELVREIVTKVATPLVTADKVRPRLVPGEKRSLLMVFNDTIEDQTAEIKIPQRYHRATDIHLSRDIPVAQNAVRVTVPFQSVVVLQLE